MHKAVLQRALSSLIVLESCDANFPLTIHVSIIYRPTLKHQRPQPEKQKKFAGLDDFYVRGKTTVSFKLYSILIS